MSIRPIEFFTRVASARLEAPTPRGVSENSDGDGLFAGVTGDDGGDTEPTLEVKKSSSNLTALLAKVKNISGSGETISDPDKKISDPGEYMRMDVGYKTAEEARAALKKDGLTDDLIDKYYDIVKDDEHGRGNYYADPKKGVTINRSEKTYESFVMGQKDDGTWEKIPRTETVINYDIKNADGTSAKIVVDALKNVGVTYYDKDGNRIPDPDVFNTNDIDTSKISGYDNNVRYTASDKNSTKAAAKLKESMAGVLNDSDLKAQLKAKFDAYIEATGRSWCNSKAESISPDEMFESFYQGAIQSTLADESLISRSGKTSSVNTQDFVNAFMQNFTKALG